MPLADEFLRQVRNYPFSPAIILGRDTYIRGLPEQSSWRLSSLLPKFREAFLHIKLVEAFLVRADLVDIDMIKPASIYCGLFSRCLAGFGPHTISSKVYASLRRFCRKF